LPTKGERHTKDSVLQDSKKTAPEWAECYGKRGKPSQKTPGKKNLNPPTKVCDRGPKKKMWRGVPRRLEENNGGRVKRKGVKGPLGE